MAFIIRKGLPEMETLWNDLSTRKQQGQLDRDEEKFFKKLVKSLGYLAENPRHVPPIKPNDRVELRENRTPLDRDTDRPAIILSREISDPTNQTVEAIGRWYAGGAVAGFYGFELYQVGDDWIIQNVIK
jgi:hypothetical protein